VGGRVVRSRSSQRGQVAGGVEITIQHETALVTAEHPDTQRQLDFHRATVRTRLGTGIPPVGHVHVLHANDCIEHVFDVSDPRSPRLSPGRVVTAADRSDSDTVGDGLDADNGLVTTVSRRPVG